MDYTVSEIFYSIQGEGLLAGVPSVFIRLSGCPLRCKWCDTAYAWDPAEGDFMSISDIVNKVASFNCRHIVVTGGEPLEVDSLDKLLEQLTASGFHITLETAALKYSSIPCDLVSISPKLSNSYPDNIDLREYAKKCFNPQAVASYLNYYDCQLKYVAATEEDVTEIIAVNEVIAGYSNFSAQELKNITLLMPKAAGRQQYREIAPQVAELALKYGFRFTPRLHVEFWGNTKGT